MTRRRWGVGLALLAFYAVVAVATHGLSSRGGRPLFDGFAPPAPYRWVKPPPEFPDNQPPTSAERTIPVTGQGSEAANASTTDAQIIVTLPQGAIPGHPPDTAVLLRIVPLDAAAAALLPAGMRAVSNAYQVSIAYQPSQAAVARVDPAAIIALTAASDGDGLLYLAPGSQQWQPVQARSFGNTLGQTGPFHGPGDYVVTASPAVATTTSAAATAAQRGGSGGAVLVAVGLAAVAAAIGATLFLRSRRQAAGRPRPTSRPGRPGRPGPARRRP